MFMSLNPGAVFAGYTIGHMLGSGGMGEVYLAQHPRLPRQDALKILRTDVSGDPDFRDRFIREADLAARLSHPNVISVYDRGECDGQLWIATTYVDGTDAAQLLRTRYPAGMPVGEASAIVSAIASALDYAHDQGLLHRDVKPANILLSQPDREGRRHVYLADFGIARPLADPNGLTATNLTVGTVAYAAPEQLMGGAIDGCADQYALATTAFHLLTGAPPYVESNPVVVISQHLNAPVPTLRERRPDLSTLDGVFRKALAKKPVERFDSCSSFARALAERVGVPNDQNATAASIAAPEPVLPEHELKKSTAAAGKGRRTLLIASAAVGSIAALVAAGTHHFSSSEIRPAPIPQAAPYEGTYRTVYDQTKQTKNGVPSVPAGAGQTTVYGAYRSMCRTDGCVASGVGLNPENPTVLRDPSLAGFRYFTNGAWVERIEPPSQVPAPRCLGPGGVTGPGTHTAITTIRSEPQPDGTLRGVMYSTFLTNECGMQGVVIEIPYVSTRTGEVPAGVQVPDPATAPPPPSTSPPPPDAPELDGLYRVDISGEMTENGAPFEFGGAGSTAWWAFRSLCNSAHCIATATLLSEMDHTIPLGYGKVLEFRNGAWKEEPELIKEIDCQPVGTNTATRSLSLKPQPDGTLRGVSTLEIVGADQCTRKGSVFKADATATRIGEAPDGVVIADPALFLQQ